ncbi:MAG TPA: hypothetical protein VJU14_05320 [Solirubrobacterales bacterium]|nr:hypothetical protein [Solirubrobacterales bacterium]
MKVDEAAVFKWVLIIGMAGAAVIAVTLLTRPLIGSLLGLVLVIAGCVHGYRWVQQKRREVGAKN